MPATGYLAFGVDHADRDLALDAVDLVPAWRAEVGGLAPAVEDERAEALGLATRTASADMEELRRTWAALVTGGGTISRSYARTEQGDLLAVVAEATRRWKAEPGSSRLNDP